ncbi:metalloprotease [Pseudomonas sp. CCM 7891]|uniref:Metalloprotease n=1 Tax=Pseudomonas karstica TaxID=1055468 RepID=A0A7X2RS92_9PSED|nr:M10 family metallopeptidase C-terminal domain-containing protein [Pseudomonas karstica]MTD20102.1 metalloprotease [Pseudomonas karstica]
MNEIVKRDPLPSAYADRNCQDNPWFFRGSALGYGKRSFTTEQAATHLTRNNSRFYDRDGDNKIDVSFKLNEFSERQRQCARQALQSWQDVANINFHESSRQADGSIQISGSRQMASGVATGPSRSHPDAWARIGTQQAPDAPRQGSYFSTIMIHEIGHTLGLAHPGSYNGSGTYERDAQYAQDTKARSVMSYWSERKQPGYDFRGLSPSAPMIDDIAAMQKLYGANHQTRNTDTTYGFNSNTGRECLSLKGPRDSALFCVWDGGGNDTLDFSGFSQNQTINLNAESFSNVGGLRGNVSIAKDVTLENALGGSGNDSLIGNEVGNRLMGGAGADRLRGGGGADTFVYAQAADSTSQDPDVIEDFSSGVDKVDISTVLKGAGLNSLNFSDQFSGRAGEAVLSYDPRTDKGSLSIDLTGNGKPDLLVTSKGEIKQGDVIVGGERPQPQPVPPQPLPQPVPQPQPDPQPQPRPAPDLMSTIASLLRDALSFFQQMYHWFRRQGAQ